VGDPVNDGGRKAEPPGGGIVANLAVFLDYVLGVDFSSALQIDRVGKYAPGDGRGEAKSRNQSEGMRRIETHGTILPRRPRRLRRTLRLDAQSGYSRGIAPPTFREEQNERL
jgi:hypothetical protein